MTTNNKQSAEEIQGWSGLPKGELEINPELKEFHRQFHEYNNTPEQKAILEKRISSLRESTKELLTFKPFKHNKK